MPDFRIVLSSLGLQGLKPVVYRAFIGKQAKAGSSEKFPAQTDEYAAGNIRGDSPDIARKSWLGTPVFSDVNFPREGKENIVLDTVLVEVSQRKNIVTTAVQGRAGTIKEYISDGDYDVRLRGAIVTAGHNRYPDDRVRDLHDLLRQSEAIPVVANYLQLFDIYSLVVTDFSFSQNEGFQNVQNFEISCISDTPEELLEVDAAPDI